MTNKEKNERIKAVEEQMAKLQKELEDIRKENVSEWDFSAWKDDISGHISTSIYDDTDSQYVSKHYFKKAGFLVNLLKFKYCYDREYVPNWSDITENKWGVYYGHIASIYEVRSFTTVENPESIYFSTQEIARKCCDWLNAGCPKE